MDFLPTSLNLLIKDFRKDKAPIAPEVRKILIFQLFKGLYYMQVYIDLNSLTAYVIETWSHPTFWSTIKRSS